MYKLGSLVTRKKYNNDILFKIVKIENNKAELKGVELRLYADADISDLQLSTVHKKKEIEEEIIRKLDYDNYFHIPGVILHIDSDKEYLDKCLKYYEKQHLKCYGYVMNENEYPKKVINLYKKHNPNIIVITGHDAYYKSKNKYKNSVYFIETVSQIRNIDKNIIIISGACQSDFENLIKYGANFASSPSHINIHALDPAIIASYLALTSQNMTADLVDILSKTKYGAYGIGGIETKGKMKIGMPRKDKN